MLPLVRSEIVKKGWMEEKDFPIFRSDGSPVFHFVNVVDDICMEITNVIRGQDHLTNTNKHIELFKAFEAPLPKFAHIPLILKSVGQGKMSKRDRGALIEEYRERRFLPEAVVNYLSLLGWNPKHDREIFSSPRDIAELFDFGGIVKSNARFDERKMAHFNTEHIRALPADRFSKICRETLDAFGLASYLNYPAEYSDKVFALCQPKVSAMDSFPSMVEYFFNDNYAFDEGGRERTFKKGDPLASMSEMLPFFESLEKVDASLLHDQLAALAEGNGIRPNDYFPALRYALSGQSGGPDLMSMAEALGKDKCVERLKRALSELK